MAKQLQDLKKPDIQQIFTAVDNELLSPAEITVIGGVSLIMLDIVERSTVDIDLANIGNVDAFKKIADRLGYLVDVVTISTTVDFHSPDKYKIFHGKNLAVFSVNERDLIKLKLERYRKQDPQDIDKIIQKIKMPFSEFRNLALEAVRDFVGHPRTFALSILMAAENHYSAGEVATLRKALGI